MAKDTKNKITTTVEKYKFLSNIVFTGGWIKGQFSEFISKWGISNPQFNILRILRGAKDWLPMSEVKDRMIEKSPNTTRLADKLVNKKYIERRRSDSDRRVVYVKITKVGLDLLDDIDAKGGKNQVGYLEKITIEEAKLVNDILDKMRN